MGRLILTGCIALAFVSPEAAIAAGVKASGERAEVAAGERVESSGRRSLSAHSKDPHRQFDFWIGVWNVNLRMLQEDLTFRDSVAARASIYSILDGKAILELWDSDQIKGYSLRYYDPAQEKWILWLDWPSQNRSSKSSLQGSFRHGRGDFHTAYTNSEGEEVLGRYSFNDISPFSLRWDDLWSKDGGKTWSKNWVMEFTRVEADPEWPIDRSEVPTFVDGGRCDEEAFRPYEVLAGSWAGDGARLDAYRILDGCAVVGFLEVAERQEFLYVSWIGSAGRWEIDVLDQGRDTGLQQYHGADRWTTMSSGDGERLEWSIEGDRLVYRRGESRISLVRQR